MKLKTAAYLTLATMFSSGAFAAGPAATVDDLHWMTGNWAGALGPNTLEENWIKAEGSSIAAMVRMTGNDATSMFEMITIEEADGSLVLHVQQFDPGFVARTPVPQEMVLTGITDNSVSFEAVAEGGFATLGYSRPDADTFIIHVGQAGGNTLDIPLKRRSLWE